MDERLRRRQLGERLEKGTGKMLEAESPDNMLTGALRAIGQMEAEGDTTLGLKIWKKATVVVCRLRLWPERDMEAALQEGRNIAKMVAEDPSES